MKKDKNIKFQYFYFLSVTFLVIINCYSGGDIYSQSQFDSQIAIIENLTLDQQQAVTSLSFIGGADSTTDLINIDEIVKIKDFINCESFYFYVSDNPIPEEYQLQDFIEGVKIEKLNIQIGQEGQVIQNFQIKNQYIKQLNILANMKFKGYSPNIFQDLTNLEKIQIIIQNVNYPEEIKYIIDEISKTNVSQLRIYYYQIFGKPQVFNNLSQTGSYLVLGDTGYCLSTVSQPVTYQLIGTNTKMCSDCNNVGCFTCLPQDTNQCTECRYSQIARNTSDCLCPIGSFENEYYTCEACPIQCNGDCIDRQHCNGCKIEPYFQRLGEDCHCPIGSYHNENEGICLGKNQNSNCQFFQYNTQYDRNQNGYNYNVMYNVIAVLIVHQSAYYVVVQQENNHHYVNVILDIMRMTKDSVLNVKNGVRLALKVKNLVIQIFLNIPIFEQRIDENQILSLVYFAIEDIFSELITKNNLNEFENIQNLKRKLVTCNSDEWDNGGVCQQCPAHCASCNNASDCTSCIGIGREYTTSLCECSTGYYDNGVDNCSTCPSNCSACNDGSTCTACIGNFKTTSSLCTNCLTGYYDNGGANCVSCPTKCSACSDGTTCTACVGNNWTTASLCTACQAGFYDNGGTDCVSCPSNCSACTDGSTCTACIGNFRTTSSLCTNCLTGYYDNGGTNCVSCPSNCSACTDGSTCTACIGNNWNISSLCKTCQTGFYDNGGTDCVACPTNCSACTDGSTCTACIGNNWNISSLCTTCQTGFYDNGGSNCVACPQYCQDCSNASTCTTGCYGSNRDLADICKCVDGFFQDGTNQNCASCPDDCQTCTSLTSCQTCIGANRDENNLCKCHDGFFDDGTNDDCQACDPLCTKCSSLTNCSECIGLNRDVNNVCVCSDGYWEQGNNDCTQCDWRCLTCTSPTDCDSCIDTTGVTRDVNNTCECKNGYYEDNQNECPPCVFPCQWCTDAVTCTKCVDPPSSAIQYRQVPVWNCACPDGTYNQTDSNHSDYLACRLCNYPCDFCIDDLTCVADECATDDYRVAGDDQCSCIDGYYDGGDGVGCVECMHVCDTCVNGISCETCADQNRSTSDNCAECSIGYFQLPSDPVCYPCDKKCLKCENNSTNCTECFNTQNRSTVTPNCDCEFGYYEYLASSGIQECSKCPDKCNGCSDQNTCDACASTTTRTFNSGACTCISGTYDTGEVDCLACPSNCSTCSNYSTCTACPAGSNRSTAKQCECSNGYYDTDAVNCSQCNFKCSTCENLATDCLTCSSTTRDINLNCACKPGYIESNTAVCTSCAAKCQTCSGSASTCTTCSDSKRDINKNCDCKDGYFDNAGTCVACQHPCSQCSGSATACTACVAGSFRQGISNNCACISDYSAPTNKYVCEQCSYPCQTCTTSKTNCTSCLTTANRVSTTNCSCNTGFYDTGTSCAACYHQCTSCSAYKTCTACSYSGSAPNCSCNPGQYDSGSTCLACPAGCTFCTGYNQCTECQNGFYDANLGLGAYKDCVQCVYPCKNCISSNICLTCDRSNTDGAPDCACSNGYFEDSSANPVCVACDYPCGNCQGSSTNCLDCYNAFRRLPAPGCGCEPSYFDYNNSCSQCEYKCDTCSSYSVCLTCSDTNRDPTNNCSCVSGYIDIQEQLCQKCSYFCSSCSGNKDNCINCSDVNRNPSDSCKCNIGFYDSGVAQCQTCSHKCQQCVSSSTYCTQCSSATRITTPNCDCKAGYYDDGVSADCVACNVECESCADSTSCITCSDVNRVLSQNCNCSDGYYSIPGDPKCYKCVSPCKTCSSATVCILCISSSNRELPSSGCNCLSGFFENGSGQCQACQYPCATCSDANTCQTCISDAQRENSHPCACNAGFFDDSSICQICDPICSTCVSSSDNCLTCIDSSRTNAPVCNCASGFFEEGNVSCTSCDRKCATCTASADNCLTCFDSTRKNPPLCGCADGYYDDGISSSCQVCDRKCKTCSGTADNCLTCYDSTRENPPTCSCVGNLQDDGVSPSCVTCSYKCDTCSSINTCINCSSVTRDPAPTCGCSPGYYEANVGDTDCTACSSPCQNCSSKTTCTSCIPGSNRNGTPSCTCISGFYDYNGICYPCQFPCQNCSNSAKTCLTCQPRANIQAAPSCECLPGYYEDSVTKDCLQCSAACQECSDFSTCTICASGLKRDYLLPDCGCLPGYFNDPAYNDCQNCPIGCETCDENGNCITCSHVTRDIDFNCACSDGYFDNGVDKACQQCDNQCGTCATSPDNCQTCANALRLSTPNCDCPSGYYDDNHSSYCLACEYPCSTCSSQSTCTTCVNTINRDPTTCQCNSGYFDNGTNCEICDDLCLECTGKSNACLVCAVGAYRTTQLPYCKCQTGYISQHGSPDCIDESNCYLLNYSLTYEDMYTYKFKILENIVFSSALKAMDLLNYSQTLCNKIFPQSFISQFGQKPSCKFENYGTYKYTLYIKVSQLTTFSPMDSLRLKDSTIFQVDCQSNNFFATTIQYHSKIDFVIDSSLSLTASISGSNFYTSCENIDVYLVDSTETGNREINSVNWQFLASNLPYDDTAHLALLNSEISALSLTDTHFYFPIQSMIQNTKYSLNAIYNNYFGNTGSAQKIIEIGENNKFYLDLTVFNQDHMFFDINKDQQIIFQTVLNNCDQISYTKKINYQIWESDSIGTLNQLLQEGQTENTIQKFYYNLKAYSQIEGVHYIMIIINIDNKLTKQQLVKYTYNSLQLFAYVLFGDRQVPLGQDIYLKAIYGDNQNQLNNLSGFSFTWDCQDPTTGSQCHDSNGNLIVLGSTQELKIDSSNLLESQQLEFIVTVQKGVNQVQASQIITIIGKTTSYQQVSISIANWVYSSKINKDKLLQFDIIYEQNTNYDNIKSKVELYYQSELKGSKTSSYLSFDFALQDIFDNYEIGDPYVKLIVYLIDSKINFNYATTFLLEVNQPPIIGQISLSNNNTYSLQNEVKITLDDCYDENLPLLYKFVYYESYSDYQNELKLGFSPESKKSHLIQDFSSQNSISTLIPVGQDMSETLIIMGIAQDSYGGQSNITTFYKINPLSQSSFNTVYNDILTKVQKGQYENNIQKIIYTSSLLQEIFNNQNLDISAVNFDTIYEILSELQKTTNLLSQQETIVNSLTKIIKFANNNKKKEISIDSDIISANVNQIRENVDYCLNSLTVREEEQTDLVTHAFYWQDKNTQNDCFTTLYSNFDYFDSLLLFQNNKQSTNRRNLAQQQDTFDIILETIINTGKMYNIFMLPNSYNVGFTGSSLKQYFSRLSNLQAKYLFKPKFSSEIFYATSDKRKNLLKNYKNSISDTQIQNLQIYDTNLSETELSKNTFSFKFLEFHSSLLPVQFFTLPEYSKQKTQVQFFDLKLQQNVNSVNSYTESTFSLKNDLLFTLAFNYPESEQTQNLELFTCIIQKQGSQNWSKDSCSTDVDEKNEVVYCNCSQMGYVTVIQDDDYIFTAKDIEKDTTSISDLFTTWLFYLVTVYFLIEILFMYLGRKQDQIDKIKVENKFQIQQYMQKEQQFQQNGQNLGENENQENNSPFGKSFHNTQQQLQQNPASLMDLQKTDIIYKKNENENENQEEFNQQQNVLQQTQEQQLANLTQFNFKNRKMQKKYQGNNRVVRRNRKQNQFEIGKNQQETAVTNFDHQTSQTKFQGFDSQSEFEIDSPFKKSKQQLKKTENQQFENLYDIQFDEKQTQLQNLQQKRRKQFSLSNTMQIFDEDNDINDKNEDKKTNYATQTKGFYKAQKFSLTNNNFMEQENQFEEEREFQITDNENKNDIKNKTFSNFKEKLSNINDINNNENEPNELQINYSNQSKINNQNNQKFVENDIIEEISQNSQQSENSNEQDFNIKIQNQLENQQNSSFVSNNNISQHNDQSFDMFKPQNTLSNINSKDNENLEKQTNGQISVVKIIDEDNEEKISYDQEKQVKSQTRKIQAFNNFDDDNQFDEISDEDIEHEDIIENQRKLQNQINQRQTQNKNEIQTQKQIENNNKQLDEKQINQRYQKTGRKDRPQELKQFKTQWSLKFDYKDDQTDDIVFKVVLLGSLFVYAFSLLNLFLHKLFSCCLKSNIKNYITILVLTLIQMGAIFLVFYKAINLEKYISNQNLQACASDEYDDNGTCQPCLYYCATCQNGNSCETCYDAGASREADINNDCPCKQNYFQVDQDPKCTQCPYMCDKCEYDNSIQGVKCNTCSGTHRQLENQCECDDGYYDNNTGVGECTECPEKCNKCYNYDGKCVECNGNYRDIQNDCECAAGYYDDGVNQDCQKCDLICGSCDSDSSNCTSCNGVDNRSTTIPDCLCNNGYYDLEQNGNLQCEACPEKCDGCTYDGVTISCDACQDLTTRNSDIQCTCQDGYYEGGQVQCLECPDICSQCTSYDDCTACVDSNADPLSRCECAPSQYKDLITDSCENCAIQCETCIYEADNCITCPVGQNRDENNSCLCEIGYYDDGGLACQQCNYKCGSCTDTDTNCTTCSESNRLVSLNCECKSGYFEQLQSCVKCDHQCATCSGSASNCLSCLPDANREDIGGGCLCKTVTLNTYTCEKCQYPCLECSGNTQTCTSCFSSTNRDTDCSCLDGFYDTQTSCEQCYHLCDTCENSAKNCLTCSSASPSKPAPNCDCEIGYFDDVANGICEQCDPSCFSCKNAANNCLKCSDGYFDANFGLSNFKNCQICQLPCQNCFSTTICLTCAYSNATPPSCDCNPGFYFDSSNQDCEQCSYPCGNCSGDANTCTSCFNDENRDLTTCQCLTNYFENGSNACATCDYKCETCSPDYQTCVTCSDQSRDIATQCGCKDGYFEINEFACEECSNKCQTCETNQDNCLQCSDPTNRDPLNNCECVDNYFDDGGELCQQCSEACANCANSSTYCTQCSSVNRGETPNCNCLNGFFDDGTPDCQACLTECGTCADATSCLTCSDENRVFSQNCVCADGYYSIPGDPKCYKCVSPCLTCSSETVCILCISDDFRNPPSAGCACLDGYYQSPFQNSCLPCNYPCGFCSDATTCLTCIDTNNRENIHPCACDPGFFDDGSICQICDEKCDTCENESDNCLTCAATRANPPLCACADGFFDEGNALCSSCGYTCATCVGTEDNCLTCYDETRVIAPDCECKNGFYDDGSSNSCVQCEYYCGTCSTSPSNCDTCYDETRDPSDCTVCISGLNDDGVSRSCVECSYQCETCSTVSDCIDCSSVTRENPPDCTCKDGFFENQVGDVDCTACSSPCENCSSQTTCTSCIAGSNRHGAPSCACLDTFYDYNGICYQCEFPCANCKDSSTSCLTCQPRANIQAAPSCECLPGFYEDSVTKDCLPCSAACQECSDFSTCTICASGLKRDYLLPDCGCLPGYFNDPAQNDCQNCPIGCETCDENGNCITCSHATRDIDFNCACLDGYFDNGVDKACQQCDNQCGTCATSPDNCQTCANALRLSTPNCECPSLFYSQPTSSECFECEYPCLDCSDQKTCLTCIDTINRDPLTCKCSSGFFDNGSFCERCDPICLECSGQSNMCLVCASGVNRSSTLPKCNCDSGYISQYVSSDCIDQSYCYLSHYYFVQTDIQTYQFQIQENIKLSDSILDLKYTEFSSELCSLLLNQSFISQFGQNPKCLLQQRSGSLKFNLSIKSSFLTKFQPGDSLIFNQNTIFLLDCYQQNSSLTQMDQMGQSAISITQIPTAKIIGSNFYSSCEKIQLSLLQESNYGQKQLLDIQWQFQSPSSTSSQIIQDNIDALNIQISNLGLNGQNQFVFPIDQMIEYHQYVISVIFKNFWGQLGFATKTIQITHNNNYYIDLTVFNLGNLIFNVNKDNQIVFQATLNNCSGISINKKMNYKIWDSDPYSTQNQLLQEGSTDNTIQIFNFDIEAFTYTEGTYYLLVQIYVNQQQIKQQLIEFTFKPLELTAYIKYGDNKEIPLSSDIILSAAFFDNQTPQNQKLSGAIIQWTCIDPETGINCQDIQDNYIQIQQKQTVTIDSSLFKLNQKLNFNLEVSYNGLVSQDSQQIVIVENVYGYENINIEISNLVQGKPVNKNQILQVDILLEDQNDIENYTIYIQIFYLGQIQAAKYFNYLSFDFIIAELFDSFQLGNPYIQLKVFVKNIYVNFLYSTTFNIEINFPPTIGDIIVNNYNYNALTETLSISCENSYDEQEPLYYKFIYYYSSSDFQNEIEMGYLPNAQNNVLIQDFSYQNTINPILPSSQDPNNIIILMVIVQDELGATTNKTVQINTVPSTQINYKNQYNQIISKINNNKYTNNLKQINDLNSLLSEFYNNQKELSQTVQIDALLIYQTLTDLQKTTNNFLISQQIVQLMTSLLNNSLDQTIIINEQIFENLKQIYSITQNCYKNLIVENSSFDSRNSYSHTWENQNDQQTYFLQLYKNLDFLNAVLNYQNAYQHNIDQNKRILATNQENHQYIDKIIEIIGSIYNQNILPNSKQIVYSGNQLNLFFARFSNQNIKQLFFPNQAADILYAKTDNRYQKYKQYQNINKDKKIQNFEFYDTNLDSGLQSHLIYAINFREYQYTTELLSYLNLEKYKNQQVFVQKLEIKLQNNDQHINLFTEKLIPLKNNVKYSLAFNYPQSEQKQNLEIFACIQYDEQNQNWNKDTCEIDINQNQQMVYCNCQEFGYTTVIQDDKHLFYEKSIEDNSITFSQIFTSWIFYILLAYFIFEVYCLYKGYKLDQNDSKKVQNLKKFQEKENKKNQTTENKSNGQEIQKYQNLNKNTENLTTVSNNQYTANLITNQNLTEQNSSPLNFQQDNQSQMIYLDSKIPAVQNNSKSEKSLDELKLTQFSYQNQKKLKNYKSHNGDRNNKRRQRNLNRKYDFQIESSQNAINNTINNNLNNNQNEFTTIGDSETIQSQKDGLNTISINYESSQNLQPKNSQSLIQQKIKKKSNYNLSQSLEEKIFKAQNFKQEQDKNQNLNQKKSSVFQQNLDLIALDDSQQDQQANKNIFFNKQENNNNYNKQNFSSFSQFQTSMNQLKMQDFNGQIKEIDLEHEQDNEQNQSIQFESSVIEQSFSQENQQNEKEFSDKIIQQNVKIRYDEQNQNLETIDFQQDHQSEKQNYNKQSNLIEISDDDCDQYFEQQQKNYEKQRNINKKIKFDLKPNQDGVNQNSANQIKQQNLDEKKNKELNSQNKVKMFKNNKVPLKFNFKNH
ncbi:Insulin-like growth factor binding protein, N-terminal [Pseudocohnilembus persalinus]|uniref:Insulin-like growth factor binding protein, N-terminal n=1 Tax=Pseudocohnilembus persalinus TaxID=266149 RepID=A0A0V0R2S9_PSEPJ|nr:Insulin-like growth factor binding protein, N-terminal [Pseudocohnilembus persalinus]|eukprot:KRX08807.1 Insulin-like growth factor binding protein, N-terminal [Pseudocohnilembus persalinus]